MPDEPAPIPADPRRPVNIRWVAKLLGISEETARQRLVDNHWPHVVRGPQGKGGVNFLPQHVDEIVQIETKRGGITTKPSTSGRTARSRARAGAA